MTSASRTGAAQMVRHDDGHYSIAHNGYSKKICPISTEPSLPKQPHLELTPTGAMK